jgi:hypothetical protein
MPSTTQKPTKCTVCMEVFPSRNKYFIHKNTHTCTICGFHTTSTLFLQHKKECGASSKPVIPPPQRKLPTPFKRSPPPSVEEEIRKSLISINSLSTKREILRAYSSLILAVTEREFFDDESNTCWCGCGCDLGLPEYYIEEVLDKIEPLFLQKIQ